MNYKNRNHRLIVFRQAGNTKLTVVNRSRILDKVSLNKTTAHLEKQSLIELVRMYRIPKGNICECGSI